MNRRLLLACGMLSSLLYVVMNIVVAAASDNYSSVSQTVSELSAIGAPARTLWVALGIVYALLVTAFGWGVRQAGTGNPRLRLTGALLLAYGLLSLAWPLAPMHQRGAAMTTTDVMHIAFAMVTVVLMLVLIGVAAAALDRRFRLYSFATIAVLLVFGTLTGIDGPRIAANLPTPWIGVWERINIGAFMLWVGVLSVVLLRQTFAAGSTHMTNAQTGSLTRHAH